MVQEIIITMTPENISGVHLGNTMCVTRLRPYDVISGCTERCDIFYDFPGIIINILGNGFGVAIIAA